MSSIARHIWLERPTNFKLLNSLGIALIAFFVSGCGPDAKNVPAEPKDAIESLVDNLEAHQPQALWHALPESFQSDLNEVKSAFCEHMDPAIYNRSMALFGKMVEVMEQKKDSFYNSPVALSTPFFDSIAGSKWDEVTGLLRVIADSDLATLDRMKQMDPGKFLATTGTEIMDRSEQIRLLSGKNNTGDPWEKLRESLQLGRIEFKELSNSRGILTMQGAEAKTPTEMEMVKIEGRWVPVKMNDGWRTGIESAKEGMSRLSGPEFQKVKPVLIFGLTSIEGVMNQLLTANSQAQFDQTLLQMVTISQTLRNMMPKQENPKPKSKNDNSDDKENVQQ